MNSNNSLDLLSNEARSLWFENMKSTLEKIIKVDLNLSKEMETEISKILVSLSTIINKNIHSKKTRLDIKIKYDGEIIKCDDVSVLLDKSNDLLSDLLLNDDKEEINAELELAIEEVGEKKLLAGKSDENKKSYLESIRYKNELKKKLEKIILLEEIIKEINIYRDKLISLVEWENTKVVSDEPLINPEVENSLDLDTKVESERDIKEEIVLEVKQEEEEEEEDLTMEGNDNDKLELFDFEVLKLIKLNLKNKKTELPKQNSLYSEVKEYFSDETRLTFYHLGLYKLISWFSDNKILDSYNAKNIIWLLDVNLACKYFIEWKLWNSEEIMLSLLWMLFNNTIRLESKYYGLLKTLHYSLLKNHWRWSVDNARNEYSKFLQITENKDTDITKFDLNNISFLDINESEEVKNKLYEEYKKETYNIKKTKVWVVRKVRARDRWNTVQDLIEKKRKLTKAYNIDKYKKIFWSVNAEKFKDFFEIDKELFLKVWSIEVVELYLSSLDRLKNNFDEDYYEKTKWFLNEYIILINNWVKDIPSFKKRTSEVVIKDEVFFRKNIEFHFINFWKTDKLNTFFKEYLNQYLTNKDFLSVLVEMLACHDISFINNFLVNLWEEYDISEIISLLEKKGLTIKIKWKINKSTIQKKIDSIYLFESEEELINFYKKEAPNFAVKKDIEYFVAFLDKFIEFDFKWRYFYTVKSRILKLKEDYEFSEKQDLFLKKIDKEKELLEKINEEMKKEKDKVVQEKIKEKEKTEQEVKIKNNVRTFAKEWKYVELREYVNWLTDEYQIDNVFLIKKMTEALLNSNNMKEVKNILYGIEE